jgi:hypothetical protein
MKRLPETSKRRRRLLEICGSLPEAEVAAIGVKDEHLALRVRKKTFAYYLYDHHGDGRIAICCKGAPGEQGRLVQDDPRRFFVPAYLGPKGWVGMRLDLGKVDWNHVLYLLRTAYRLTAPRALVARLE